MDARKTKQLLLGGLVAAFVGGALTGCSEKVEEVTPEVVRPIKSMIVGGRLAGQLSFPGRVQGSRRVELSFRVSGRLEQLPILEGQNVAQGALIGRLDPTDYQIAVQAAQATYIKSEADFTRYQRLYEKDAVPLSDLDRFRAQRDVAKARLDQAETNLRYTSLLAPFAGRLGEKSVENHEDVIANQPIVSLHDVTRIEIVIDVPEYLMADVREGFEIMPVARFETVSNTEYPLEFKEASAQADIETQTYKVTLSMPQPEGIRVLPGMSSLVTLKVSQTGDATTHHVFTIPATSVVAAADGTPYVWVVDEGQMTVHRRDVSIGEVTGEAGIRILDGLKAGERVATAAANHLREGMRVTLWTASP